MNTTDCNLSVSSIQEIISNQASTLEGFQKSVNGQKVPYMVAGAFVHSVSKWFLRDDMYYNVQLKDLDDPQKNIQLNIPVALVKKYDLKGYEFINAVGFIKIVYLSNSNQFSPRFHVLDIKVNKSSNQELIESNKVFSSFFKNIPLKQHNFPLYQHLSIAVIVPLSGSSFDEFTQQIKFNNSITFDIERISINIYSKHAIINAVNEVRGSDKYNILVIARGGGDIETLDIFDDPDICESVAKFDGYKVIGIGHAVNQTLLDVIADYSAETPTAAGSHIKDVINALDFHKYKFITNSQFEMKQEITDLDKKNIELKNKLTKTYYIVAFLAISIIVAVYFLFSDESKVVKQDGQNNEANQVTQVESISTEPTKKKHKH